MLFGRLIEQRLETIFAFLPASGEVELDHVPLRRDALRFLNAAVDVRSGFVGRIRLKIPVSRLRSEPWSLTMEKVYIVTGPQRLVGQSARGRNL